MTGPEHYREAERLIDEANHVGHRDPQRGDGILAAAQVHATLALAAATAMQPSGYAVGSREFDEWQAVCWPKWGGGQCACDHHGEHAGCGTTCECAR